MKNNYIVYVGTYAQENQPGIFQYILDSEKREFRAVQQITGISNPSYLALSGDGSLLYAVMEDTSYQGKPGGGLAVLKRKNGRMERSSSAGTGGTLPCHILLDEKNHFAFAANYLSGSLSMFSLAQNGDILNLCDFKQHEGCGPNPLRQEGPHIHFSGIHPNGTGLWCTDLGNDKVFYYKIDHDAKCLVPYPQWDIVFPAGCGPRHFAINPQDSKWMYVVCELSSEVFVVDISGTPEIIQKVSTLPENTPDSTCAAIKCSADGRFVYASNRGDDSIAVFAVDSATGLLHPVQIQNTMGKTPRDILILEDMLLAANQDSDCITCFRRDEMTGRLEPEKAGISCPVPVCIVAHPV